MLWKIILTALALQNAPESEWKKRNVISDVSPTDDSVSLLGNVIKGKQYRWSTVEKGMYRVPYILDKKFNSREKGRIKFVMGVYRKVTCINFTPWKAGDRDYIKIIRADDKNACESDLGKKGGEQVMLLGYHCLQSKPHIMHELGHSIGLLHEHQRKDRKRYIKINEGNIMSGINKTANFDVHKESEEELVSGTGREFDFKSIMMYGMYAFSQKKGILKTIEPLNPKDELIDLEKKKGLSNSDVIRINKIYPCKKLSAMERLESLIEKIKKIKIY